MNKWFTSSTGSGDLALTIKGLLVALVPLSRTAFKYYGIDVAETDVVSWVDAIIAGVSAIMIIVGLIRKAANRLQ